MQELEGFRERAKLAEDQILELETIVKSFIQAKCKKYRYEVVYYHLKNRGNFIRLLFEEAGIPYTNITEMTYFRCRNQLSKENSDKFKYDLFAPPAVIRYPIDPKSNEEIVAISQTVPIISFLSQELNLCPSTLSDHYRQQMLAANANDILTEIFKHKDASFSDLNTFFTERIQIWLDILEKPLKVKANQEYYFDDRCLAVDIVIYNICEGIIDIMDERTKELFIDTHPILYKHYTLIKNRKTIKTFTDQQKKEKYDWWPNAYGFGACRDRLNKRDIVEKVEDEKNTVK